MGCCFSQVEDEPPKKIITSHTQVQPVYGYVAPQIQVQPFAQQQPQAQTFYGNAYWQQPTAQVPMYIATAPPTPVATSRYGGVAAGVVGGLMLGSIAEDILDPTSHELDS